MKECPQCGTSLPDEARYCWYCGVPQLAALGREKGKALDWSLPLEPQLRQWFRQALHERISEEQHPDDLPRYARRLEEYGFLATVDRRLEQLAFDIQQRGSSSGPDQVMAEKLAFPVFEELLDFFIIHHCKEINRIPLPEAILKYPYRLPDSVDLYAMILDFLDLAREEEDIFLDAQFLAMPTEKLRNAGKSFLFPGKEERIFLIGDQSLFGSCREGFAFTDRALYWRAHLQRPQRVVYTELSVIRRERNWLTINDAFFNVNPTLNVKILKLLRRLKHWYTSIT